MSEKSATPGTATSVPEITHVSSHGFWLLLNDEELFLPFTDFPWFSGATLSQLFNVQLLFGDHLFWPELDVDLSLESVRNPAAFPLVAK